MGYEKNVKLSCDSKISKKFEKNLQKFEKSWKIRLASFKYSNSRGVGQDPSYWEKKFSISVRLPVDWYKKTFIKLQIPL